MLLRYLSKSKMGNRSQFRNVTSALPQRDKMCRENQLLSSVNSYSSIFILTFCEYSWCKDFLVDFVEDVLLKRKKKSKFDSSSQFWQQPAR